MESPPRYIREDIEAGFRWPLGEELVSSETAVEYKGGAGNYDVWTTLQFTNSVVRIRIAEWCGDSRYGPVIEGEPRRAEGTQTVA